MTRLFSCVPGTRCVPAPDHRFFDRNDRPRIHRLMMLLICFFGIIACSHRSPDPMTETCAAPSGALFFWTEPEESLAIGKTRTLTPYKADMPGAQEPISSACLSNIRVSPEAAGSIRKGPLGDHLLVVSSTAPAGLAAYVEADYLGERIRSQFRVLTQLQILWSGNIGSRIPRDALRAPKFRNLFSLRVGSSPSFGISSNGGRIVRAVTTMILKPAHLNLFRLMAAGQKPD